LDEAQWGCQQTAAAVWKRKINEEPRGLEKLKTDFAAAGCPAVRFGCPGVGENGTL